MFVSWHAFGKAYVLPAWNCAVIKFRLQKRMHNTHLGPTPNRLHPCCLLVCLSSSHELPAFFLSFLVGPHFTNFNIISLFLICLFVVINPGKIYEWGPWNYVPFGTFTDNPGICPRIMDREIFSLIMCKFH